jgi:hypothetical protein
MIPLPDSSAGNSNLPQSGDNPSCQVAAREDVDGTTDPCACDGAAIQALVSWESVGPISADAGLAARLTEIAQIFDHAGLSALAKAELAAEYYDLYERLYGRDVQNRPGRPGIVSEVARSLTLPGKTADARRKSLERALAVARMSDAAKDAARKAGIDRHQKPLLDIAKAGDERAQLRKVAEVAARKRASGKRVKGKKVLRPVIRLPIDRERDVVAKLTELADDLGVELLAPSSPDASTAVKASETE